mmetsp:Transcript_19234/g.30052  ORF Transcript_19234/g.30052 Transcript_19234/m.30052 type:complete len:82 (+) Transcript_19234:1816-2061(+)
MSSQQCVEPDIDPPFSVVHTATISLHEECLVSWRHIPWSQESRRIRGLLLFLTPADRWGDVFVAVVLFAALKCGMRIRLMQ